MNLVGKQARRKNRIDYVKLLTGYIIISIHKNLKVPKLMELNACSLCCCFFLLLLFVGFFCHVLSHLYFDTISFFPIERELLLVVVL